MSLGKQEASKRTSLMNRCETVGEKEVELRFKDPARKSLIPSQYFFKSKVWSMAYSSSTPGRLLKMQNLKAHPDLLSQNMHLNMTPR